MGVSGHLRRLRGISGQPDPLEMGALCTHSQEPVHSAPAWLPRARRSGVQAVRQRAQAAPRRRAAIGGRSDPPPGGAGEPGRPLSSKTGYENKGREPVPSGNISSIFEAGPL